MDKKIYEAPVVKKVTLEIRNAVLSVCFTSSDPASPDDTCHVGTSCYVGGIIP